MTIGIVNNESSVALVIESTEGTYTAPSAGTDYVEVLAEGTSANKTREENYPKQLLFRNFVIIQMFEGRAVYNITFFTRSFKTINVKLSAENGEIIKHSLSDLISM